MSSFPATICGKLCRMMKNARKLTDVFREHGDPFMAPEDEDEIYNLLTKEVMTEKVSKDVIIIGTKRDWTTHVCGIRHRALDRGTTLCVGQNDKEEAQNIQDLKCHGRN